MSCDKGCCKATNCLPIVVVRQRNREQQWRRAWTTSPKTGIFDICENWRRVREPMLKRSWLKESRKLIEIIGWWIKIILRPIQLPFQFLSQSESGNWEIKILIYSSKGSESEIIINYHIKSSRYMALLQRPLRAMIPSNTMPPYKRVETIKSFQKLRNESLL